MDSTVLVDNNVALSQEDIDAIAKIPQWTKVLNHLIRFGSITDNEARDYYGITRLAAHIYFLKNKCEPPVNIVAETVSGYNRFGQKTYYAKYHLVEEEKT